MTILRKIIFIPFSLFAPCLLSSWVSAAQPVIFDTDMAIDDWSALLTLAMNDDINLVAVTANGVGETRCQPALKNIPKLLDLTQQDSVEFSCGDDYPLEGFFTFPEPWREQADTLSGIQLPESQRVASSLNAVDLIHKHLTISQEKIIIVATGSLTNIAQWLDSYPNDKEKVERLVIMGGAIGVPGNIIVPNFTDNHPNHDAEWNIYVDPLAAKKVFSSGLPIVLVGLDITNTVKVAHGFAKNFKQAVKTDAAKFWDQVLDDNDWFIESGEYYFWDVLAAIIAIEPEFCEGDFHSVDVSVDLLDEATSFSNEAIPNTKNNGETRQHLNPKTSGVTRIGGTNPKVKICRNTDAPKVFSFFTETLNIN